MIYIASDHAGFELKNQIVEYLNSQNLEVEDCGPNTYDPEDDYPDFILPCAEKVAMLPENFGIVLGMSGNGEAIAANKVKGVRAAHYYGGAEEIVSLARKHNNANVLALGAKFLTMEEIKKAINIFLKTDFEDGRHSRRVDKISNYELGIRN